MSMRPQDLNFGGGEATESLLSPENQVPAPPILQTVEEIEAELSDTKRLYADTKLGFGNTKLVQYKSQTQLDSAKSQAFKLINETIPQKLKLRKQWENKYSAKRLQLFGEDTKLMTAQEVYDTQQLLKGATNTNDPELQAYDQAVARVDELKTKFVTEGTPESQLTGAEQQLALAAAWKQVIPTITAKVKQLRAKNLPTVLGKYGELGTLTNFVPVSDVEKNVGAAISQANKLAEVEFSTETVEATDKYGRPTSYTRLRDQEQSNQLARFKDRATQIANATPQQAATLVGVQVGAPTSAAAAKEGGTQNVVPAPIKPATGSRAAGATTVTSKTSAVTAAPPGIRGGMVIPTTAATPGGGGGGGGGGVGTGVSGKPAKPKGVSADAWKDILRQTFPSYTNEWLSDNAATHFGPDLVALMVEASKPNGKYQGLTTEEGRTAYALALKQTVYYQTTESNARDFDQRTTANKQALVNNKKLEIVDAYGDLGFDEATLTALATDAARRGVTGLGLKQAVYSGTFKQQSAQPALARRALEGADADAIRKSARAYGYSVSDAEVEAALTGGMYNGVTVSSESILQKAQKAAKGVYSHLSDQIDAGLSLDDIFSNYKRYAASVLELDESQIDFAKDPKWQAAFGSKESGQMSLGDWVTKLKSDQSFGWQYTKQANQQATDVGLTLARAFGKVG